MKQKAEARETLECLRVFYKVQEVFWQIYTLTRRKKERDMHTIRLDGEWKLQYGSWGDGQGRGWHIDEADDADWLPAQVPGDVRLDLMSAGLIAEPLYGENAPLSQWIEDREWWYRKEWVLPPEFARDRIELTFHGMEHTAKVWVNGQLAGEHANSFRPCTLDVTAYVREGRNVIAVCLDVGLRAVEGADWKPYVMGEHVDWRRALVRKPAFSFKWDWAPRLLNCGLWRGVEVNGYRTAALRRVRVEGIPEGDTAAIEARMELDNFTAAPQEATVVVCVTDEDGRTFRSSVAIDAKPGVFGHVVRVPVPNPKLWWPIPYGSASLYEVRVEAAIQGRVVHVHETRVGIRTVELLRERHASGQGEEGAEDESFTFVVNGVPIFCQGANWVPADSILARASEEKIRALVDTAAEANMNMLRVWGGGIYEDPAFYRRCDERGIMVWQDFMFACAYYPEDEEYLAEVEREAEWAVAALGHHPSIVLWCGNNEVDWGHATLSKDDGTKPFRGESIFHRVLPTVCASLDPRRPYWPGSPYGGKDPNGAEQGDKHFWEVSVQAENPENRVDYRRYALDLSKFCSEFGVLSPPMKKSVADYLPVGARHGKSSAWAFHNNFLEQGNIGGQLRLFYKPVEQLSFDDYLRYGLMLQAEALKFAFEHYKRRKFACGGALFWMYSDCWGATGWTVVDYYMRRKPSYYAVKRALRPVTVSWKRENDQLSLHVVNDRRTAFRGTVRWWLANYDGKSAAQSDDALVDGAGGEAEFSVAANGVAEVASFSIADLPEAVLRQAAYRAVVEEAGQGAVTGNEYFMALFGELALEEPQLRARWAERAVGDPTEIHALILECDAFAWMVEIEAPDDVWLEDNYVHLWPGEPVVICVRGKPSSLRKLSVQALNMKSAITPVSYGAFASDG